VSVVSTKNTKITKVTKVTKITHVTPALDAQLRGIRAIAFDLDGVLYEGDRPIPGAVQTVAAVRGAGLPVRFVTNTTSLSRRLIADKLKRLGFAASAGELFCPARAAAAWLLRAGLSASLFVPEAAFEDFEAVARDDERPGAVVVGDLESGWTFEALNRAFRLVHERNAQLVGLGRTRYWKGPRGLQLDVGPFLAALEHATGKIAVVFGKPEPAFFAGLVEDLVQPADRIAMIGDDIASDIGAAMKAGLVGVLVRTGKFDQRDLDGAILPDLVIDSVAALTGLLPQLVRDV
jgi:HAD superfamily hydrolase (TIGR01458 family)